MDLENCTKPERSSEVRAYGGCLGTWSRRRTRQAAKRSGEPQAGEDPEVSEWGNPLEVILEYPLMNT